MSSTHSHASQSPGLHAAATQCRGFQRGPMGKRVATPEAGIFRRTGSPWNRIRAAVHARQARAGCACQATSERPGTPSHPALLPWPGYSLEGLRALQLFIHSWLPAGSKAQVNPSIASVVQAWVPKHRQPSSGGSQVRSSTSPQVQHAGPDCRSREGAG